MPGHTVLRIGSAGRLSTSDDSWKATFKAPVPPIWRLPEFDQHYHAPITLQWHKGATRLSCRGGWPTLANATYSWAAPSSAGFARWLRGVCPAIAGASAWLRVTPALKQIPPFVGMTMSSNDKGVGMTREQRTS